MRLLPLGLGICGFHDRIRRQLESCEPWTKGVNLACSSYLYEKAPSMLSAGL